MPDRPLTKVLRSSLFLFLNLALLILLLTTPGDIIHQSITADRRYNIITVSGVFILTFIVVLVVYASRLYTNRSILASIPKKWIPIEQEDVGYKLWAMIQTGLLQSATVAYKARPRSLNGKPSEELKMPTEHTAQGSKATDENRSDSKDGEDATSGTMASVERPPWGPISHPGWSSPSASDIPNVQYCTVVAEIPNLIEARAVSICADGTNDDLLELLSRRNSISLRAYLPFLASMGMLGKKDPEVQQLVEIYEKARFSGVPLSEEEFRALTTSSAHLLQSMVGPSTRASSTHSSYVSSIKSSLNS